ncbi:MAG TPA: arginine--tRNA ligase [Thermoleophilaceae bacterium]
MSPTIDPVAELRAAVAAAAAELSGNGSSKTFSFDRPPKPEFGDYSTNAAMLLAPTLGEQPRAVAERLGGLVEERLADEVEKVAVAGPGFLNLFLSDSWYRDALGAALAAGDEFGGGTVASAAERILVEFVSANPTGPITVASARHAAYGDALSRILEFAGHEVAREYYVNDEGGQVQRFGQSIKARARGEEPPEDGYHGGYVSELADQIEGAADMEEGELARRAVDLMIDSVRATLERFGVQMDLYFFEHTVHENGEMAHALAILDEHGHTYEHENALWLRTTRFGDDKDRVLRRSTGEFTYFGPDIAYHVDKRERGFDRLIDVWGADHHGYQQRTLAAWEALGGEPGRLELIIMQLVNLVERGQRVQMSKRRGEFVTLDDLIDDIGVDAARFFLLQRSHDTTLDLDLTLAREQSQDNPVYYVQYAHARIASILRKAGEQRVAEALAADYSEELHPSARALLKRLLAFPDEVGIATERRAPHRITVYAHDAAQDFSAFYRDCRVVGAAEEGGDENFRIALSVMAQRVLARSLSLLGVSAPEHM